MDHMEAQGDLLRTCRDDGVVPTSGQDTDGPESQARQGRRCCRGTWPSGEMEVPRGSRALELGRGGT